MKNILQILILLSFFGCKKPEDRTCMKKAGEESMQEFYMKGIKKLYLREQIVFHLVQDTVEKIVLKGGKNLLNQIHIEHGEDGWEIRNDNRCQFLRSYKKKVYAEIHFIDIHKIRFEGTETLTNKDTMNVGSFNLLMRDGAGSVDLKIITGWLNVGVTSGFGDFKLQGRTNFAQLFTKGNGYGDALGLKVKDSINVRQESAGSIKVNADKTVLNSLILSNGNVWYKGKPERIKAVFQGKGQLLQMN